MSEQFYDSEIAPKLLELANMCHARGMSFVANVEYAPGETSSTVSLTGSAGFKLQLTAWAARCHANVDALWIQIMRYAREHGHSSMHLHLSGVPEQKDQKKVDEVLANG